MQKFWTVFWIVLLLWNVMSLGFSVGHHSWWRAAVGLGVVALCAFQVRGQLRRALRK